MIYIVEGIDRVGKTTLCNLMSERLEIGVLKDRMLHGELQRDIVDEKIFTTVNALESMRKVDLIIDRFHLSEIVYGKIDREYDNEFMWEIDKRLAEMETMLILVEPENKTRLNIASWEHGDDLSEHAELFEKVFDESAIKMKARTKFRSFRNFVENLK